MTKSNSQLLRFIRTIHRRLVLLHVMERVGVCLLTASLIGVVLLAVMLIQGQPGLAFALTISGVSIGVGTVWGLVSRPGLLAAAMQADRQLRLHDLLSTVITLPPGSQVTEGWNQTLVALANDRCASLSPGAVALRRWGRKAWGSTALATSLLLTIALLTVNPQTSGADGLHQSNGNRSEILKSLTSLDAQTGGRSTERLRVPDRFTGGPDGGGPQDDGTQSTSTDSTDRHSTAKPATGGSTSASGGSGAQGSTGAGNSQTAARHTAEPPLAAGTADASNGSPTKTISQGGGGNQNQTPPGGAPVDPNGTGMAAGSTSASTSVPPPVAPWQRGSWQSDARQAIQTAHDRHLSDDYRTLINDYFKAE